MLKEGTWVKFYIEYTTPMIVGRIIDCHKLVMDINDTTFDVYAHFEYAIKTYQDGGTVYWRTENVVYPLSDEEAMIYELEN